MNKDTFIKLIKSQGSISQEELASLDDVLKSFPTCNAANILMAKGTFDKGSMFSTQKVKRAALFTPSREVLKRLIHNQNALTETPDVQSLETEPVKIEQVVLEPQEETIVLSNEEKIQEANLKDELVDEIYKNLSSLKSIKETVSEINKAELISKPTLSEKKTPKGSVAQPLKYYVHTSEFDKIARRASVDLISEYLAYRNDKSATGSEVPEVVEAPDLETQINIIQKFINDSPTISKPSPFTDVTPNIDLSQKSTKGDFDLVTETLANLLVKQEKYKKAIEAFEKLILKYPDKTTYFAQKIEFTKSLIK